MAATKMFLIKWYSSSTNLESSGLLGSLLTKSSGLPGSRLDFQEVVWTSRKSSGLLFVWIFLSVSVFQIWKTSGTTYLLVVWKSSGSRLDFLKVVWTSCKVVWKSSGSRLDFLKVVWTSCKVVWKSSELPKSLLAKSSELPGSRLDFLEVTTYNSVVHETTEIRLKCKSSGEVKLLKLSIDDLTFSRLRLQISKSIAKITSALTRRLPGKSSTARRLKGKSSTARRLPKIKILGFFSSLWRESERYVVFSSQEWKKKKGKSILGALRASNWLFMVVVVLMIMAIL
ncbi:hypothetical protein IGI04_000457 [Brassica rapa subsp. trilocularis]|uniref:Uncharacterized protein n=1 Tax=Brassica rapa subsp. trilocularis TaxID=1813537 RepID=A0ABQ7NPX8_BRACM|nr:hypothetical protein IGI04_000457 [Brassica rapa subsp. trilocularis]